MRAGRPGEPERRLIFGVPPDALLAHALHQIAPTLRHEVASFEFDEGGRVLHMGLETERVIWKAIWRRPGLPLVSGSFVVWDGTPI